MGVRGVCTDTNLSLSGGPLAMNIYIPLLFLLASFVMAVVRRTVSTEALAIWAIAAAMILSHVHLTT
jgi:hypothetical protein